MPRYRTIACEHCGHLLLKRDEYCEVCGRMTRRERMLWTVKVLHVVVVILAAAFVYWTLNGLAPQDVRVECILHRSLGSELAVPVQGFADNRRFEPGVSYVDGEPVLLDQFEPLSSEPAAVCRYRLEFQPPWAGSLLYEIRAVPQHPHLTQAYELGLMRKL